VIITEYLQSLVYLHEKNWEQADRLARKVIAEADKNGLAFEHLSATKTLAIVALNSDNADAAIEQLRIVAQKSRSMNHIWLEFETLLVLEKTLYQKGNRDPVIRERLKEITSYLTENTKAPCLEKYIDRLIQTINQGYITPNS
jgi:hypothetical protein